MYHRTPRKITSESDHLKVLRERYLGVTDLPKEGHLVEHIGRVQREIQEKIREGEALQKRIRREISELRETREAYIALAVLNREAPIKRLKEVSGVKSNKTLYNIRDRFLTSQNSPVRL